MKKAYFNRDKLLKWTKLNPDEITHEDFSDPEHWSVDFDGNDITGCIEPANDAEKTKFPNIDFVFVISRYNDYAEFDGKVIIHPDWVDWS